MDRTTPKLTAIVAAYNETPRIHAVLDVLTTYDRFDEIVVVDDGSTDGTADVAATYPVTVIRLDTNGGKGHAMDVGVQHAAKGVIFFADADIFGLSHEMIDETTTPVLAGACEMFILMRNRMSFVVTSLLKFLPLLGGERALTTDLWERLPATYKQGFRIEAGLNFYAIHHGGGLEYRVFRGITQTRKEAKFGFVEGMRRRVSMSWEVVAAAWELQRAALPPSTRIRRAMAATATLAMVGMLLSVLVVAAGLTGPSEFAHRLFASELAQDPGAPLANGLIGLASMLRGPGVMTAGLLLLAANVAYFLRSLVRMMTVDRVRRAA